MWGDICSAEKPFSERNGLEGGAGVGGYEETKGIIPFSPRNSHSSCMSQLMTPNPRVHDTRCG